MPVRLGGLPGHFRLHYRLVAKQTNHVTGELQVSVTLGSGERKGDRAQLPVSKGLIVVLCNRTSQSLKQHGLESFHAGEHQRVWCSREATEAPSTPVLCGAVEKSQRLPPHLSYASLLFLSLSFHLYNKLVIVNKAAFLSSTLHSGRLPEDHGAAQILAG